MHIKIIKYFINMICANLVFYNWREHYSPLEVYIFRKRKIILTPFLIIKYYFCGCNTKY